MSTKLKKTVSNSRLAKSEYIGLVKAMFGADVKILLPKNDGLSEVWDCKTIFVNPPYGRDKERGTSISDWLRKCAVTHNLYGSEILVLVPVATNTSHWKNFIFGEASAVCFLSDEKSKTPCAIIYYGQNIAKFKFIFSEYGAVLNITDLLSPIAI